MVSVEIYTTQTCPYCRRAKALLKDKGINYREISVDGDDKLRREMMKRANGGYTVPQIFIDNEHIGGCDDMVALDYAGKLDAKLGITK